MDTKITSRVQHENLTFIQLAAGAQYDVDFRPGGPAIREGGLIIREVSESGDVNQVMAENRTGDLLLLTDAEILSGAKQTRILNKSVLLAPHSTIRLPVSCVERSRWQKRSEHFDISPGAASPDLRAAKADFSRSAKKSGRPARSFQSDIWQEIEGQMAMSAFESRTESYEELTGFLDAKHGKKGIGIDTAEGSNGLMIILRGHLLSLDLYGNEATYRYYFRGLVNAAERQAGIPPASGLKTGPFDGENIRQILDALNDLSRERDHDYVGAGAMFAIEKENLLGQELQYADQLVHLNLFGLNASRP